MAEVAIRAHTRRGKGGKTVQVRGYSRRVGRKGIHSPKRNKSEQPGEEYEKKVEEKKETPKLTPEEITQRRELMEGFKRAKVEIKPFRMLKEHYARYKKQRESKKKASAPTHAKTIKNPQSLQGSLGILERVEDKVAKFVEKYSGKKYKRQL